ncbi:amino acid ABC transporter substrate-binding protein [Actinoplanes cyaneus]|jgi:ABC-type branched-subunit amino acid transport system substrate-binding protein|uniref:Amino acid ABC transporter substrate-binding protein n=1 Tax=Actinoplanes cyaneus TaxID=52696 RepID=A0A919LYU7_9ACTN|nr:ABC transporter substrate-binding protein [Actinoplanes cyaneus]MCW2137328.1 branched-chain amino acid transport system substrate-binding protein [Actinoplanes cyaneus]GID63380.1 amino acid ABC transporter substrate-binding protein [Actinoplanes cyaneus]
MIRRNFAWRSVAVLGAASLALGACSNDSKEPAAGSSSAATSAGGDGVLKIGTLLPQTGSLAFLGPPEFAGVKLAVKDINAAGGVLGKDVVESDTDSGDTSTDIASQSVNKLLAEKADVVIGAASSSVSLSVIDKITGAGVVQISPANTSDQFTTYNDKGLYFRTAPPDQLQGRVLGDLIVADGNAKVGLLVMQDAYGTGLAKSARGSIESGGGQIVAEEVYDPKAADFSAEVGKIKTANPDAIVMIGFDETKKIVPKLVEAGLTSKTKKWYFVDGNLSNYGKEFPNGTFEGAKGTTPGAKANDDFKKQLLTIDPALKDYTYSAESYDATILTALAATAAKSDAPADYSKKLTDVSKGGEKCTTFKDCKALLDAGKDIDYDGMSGPIEWNDAGDPAEATIGIYQYGADNTYKNVAYQTGKIS